MIGVKTRCLPLAIEPSLFCWIITASAAAALLSKFISGVSTLFLLPEISASSVLVYEDVKLFLASSISCLLPSSFDWCSVSLGMNLRYFYCLDIELLAKVSAMVLLWCFWSDVLPIVYFNRFFCTTDCKIF